MNEDDSCNMGDTYKRDEKKKEALLVNAELKSR
jgi:hypothetical protein